MSVSGTTNRATFSGNSSTTVFAFPYYLTASSDLKVLGTDANGVVTTYVLNTDYTFAGTLDANNMYSGGGNITFSVAPATGITLTLYRDPPRTQATVWVDGDPDPAKSKITSFDKATLLVQRLYDLISRSVGLADGDVSSFNPQLPLPIVAGATLQVNDTATGWTFAGTNATTSSAPQSVTSGGVTINQAAAFQVIYIKGSGGAVDLSGQSTQIQASNVANARVVLVGTDATNTVKFGNGGNVIRNGAYTMGDGAVSEYLYDKTAAKWRMISDNEI